jgi:hypothetical protein
MRDRLGPPGWSGVAALVLAVAYLVAPPLGTDLSAQVAHADFVRDFGLTPVDFRWYGGTVQYGYSAVSPAVMALLGARFTGALGLLASSMLLALLLSRTGARRPLLGGLLGTAAFAGNLVSGRVTFALGMAFGLAALLALTAPRRWVRLTFAVAGAVLAAATSPVAGLFLGLACAALLLARRLGWEPVVVGLASAVPIGVMAWASGPGGWMNIGRTDTIHAVVTGVLVALVVPWRAVRIGAALAAIGVLAAFAVHTPVGLNATRLATVFALPVVAAFAVLRWRWLVPMLVALAVWQPPLLVGDLRDVGNPTASRAYWAPLLRELARRAPVGRVEVPPTRDYWESAYVARSVPLARGWLRQVDLADNGLFFTPSLDAARYRDWLADNGVTYVALPDAELSWVARSEGALIRGGVPFLAPVWHDEHWTLYTVQGGQSIVDGATLVSSTGAAVRFDVSAPDSTVLVRVRWSRWLRIDGPRGARLAPTGRWTRVRVSTPGRYTVTS